MPNGHVMNVLHLCWVLEPETTVAGSLCAWIERGERKDEAAGGDRAAPAAIPDSGVPGWPLALEADATIDLLKPLAPNLQPRTAVMWLPTAGTNPLPSPQACEDSAAPEAPVALARWLVPMATWPMGELWPWLARIPEGGLIRPNGKLLRPGSDLLWYRGLARLAQHVIEREQYVPAVTANGTGLLAWWRLLMDERKLARPLKLLAAAMPPAAVVVAEPAVHRTAQPPRLPDPAWVAWRILESAVDAGVRSTSQLDHIIDEGEAELPIGPAFSMALFAPRIEAAHVRLESGQRETLLGGVDKWTKELVEPPEAPRLCLQIIPPSEKGAEESHHNGEPTPPGFPPAHPIDWCLAFFLQSPSDASLLISAQEVWKGRAQRLAGMFRMGRDPQDVLLSELARAARICPVLERSLQDRQPVSCRLNAVEAHHFLKDQAALLQEAGFTVRLPNWWKGTQPTQQLSVKLHLTPLTGGVDPASPVVAGNQLTLDTLVKFNWQVAIGETTLSAEDFERLATYKTPLVKVRGAWVELSPEQVGAIRELLSGQAPKTGLLRDALSLGLGAGMTEVLKNAKPGSDLRTALQIAGITSEGWIAPQLDRLLGTAEVRLEPVALPPEFKGTLRPYQEVGLSWLIFLRKVGLGALLADDMGLGKTVQMLAAIQHWKNEAQALPAPAPAPAGPASGPLPVRTTLLIAPTSVVANWRQEAHRFTPQLNVLVHQGPSRLKGLAFRDAALAADLVVTSYALVQRDFELLAGLRWSVVVLDEAQAVKNAETKTTRAVRNLQAGYRAALTGTPVENHLSELWSICEFLNPSYLGTAAGFRRIFVTPIERNRDPQATAQLRKLVAPLLLRRLKTDRRIITDLPEKIESTVYCKLTQEQAALYQAIVKDSMGEIGKVSGIARKGAVLSAITRLKQVCNHPAHYLADNSPVTERSGKVNRLVEMLEEILEAGDRALLFTQFTRFGQLVRSFLEERFAREILFLHGGTPPALREQLITRFQSALPGEEEAEAGASVLQDAPSLFVLSLKAGGMGLNLTAANHVFHLDRWWNPAVENQATDRAFRIGQKRTVQVHKFVCEGTLEERIDEMLESKKELAATIIAGGEEWITEMSTDQLRDLFELRESAVE